VLSSPTNLPTFLKFPHWAERRRRGQFSLTEFFSYKSCRPRHSSATLYAVTACFPCLSPRAPSWHPFLPWVIPPPLFSSTVPCVQWSVRRRFVFLYPHPLSILVLPGRNHVLPVCDQCARHREKLGGFLFSYPFRADPSPLAFFVLFPIIVTAFFAFLTLPSRR